MLSRRELLERAAAGTVAVAGGLFTNVRDAAAQNVGMRDLVLTNGKFVDGRGQVGTTLTIRNGRIATVGKPGIVRGSAAADEGGVG